MYQVFCFDVNLFSPKRGVGHGVRVDHQLEVAAAISDLNRASSRGDGETEQDLLILLLLLLLVLFAIFELV